MILGITGTDGGGKGENSLGDYSQGLASSFVSEANKSSDKVYCACKAPVPNVVKVSY